MHFDLQGFERMVRKLTRASNSLTVGIVIAGLFVASSLVLRVGFRHARLRRLRHGICALPLARLEHVERLI